jgi:hypothetical protein
MSHVPGFLLVFNQKLGEGFSNTLYETRDRATDPAKSAEQPA